MAFSNLGKPDQNKPPKPSDPITINPSGCAALRRRSASMSSSSSDSGSSPEVPTPLSALSTTQRINIPPSSTSPILSYFLAQSPTKSTSSAMGTFPFKRKFGTVPVYEGDEQEPEIPVAAHARRASTALPGRFLQNPPIPEPQHQRGANTLRRLSLSSGFIKPQLSAQSGRTQSPPPFSPPPNTAVSPTQATSFAKPTRSATIHGDNRKQRRAPSPMGERILKGHFDGFN